MQLRDIMTENVQCIKADQTLLTAAQMMKDFEIGLLPVMDKDQVVGTLTDRDIVVYGLAAGKDPHTTLAREIMSGEVISCSEDADVDEAADLMKQHKIRRLIVTDDQNHPTGIVSLGDLATLGDNEQMTQDVLERVSTGHELRPSH